MIGGVEAKTLTHTPLYFLQQYIKKKYLERMRGGGGLHMLIV